VSAVAVIAVGNPYRHDDGVGPAALSMLRTELPEVDLFELDGEPTRLLDAWTGRRLAVVVDAVRAGSEPGSIHRIEVGVDTVPAPAIQGSTHATGLVEAVAVARALDRLPERLVLFGIEPADLGNGAGLSSAAERALPGLVRCIVAEARPLCA